MQKLKLAPHEEVVFDIYFAGIVSMAHCHPGSGSTRYGTTPKSLEGCADLALQMITIRREVMG